MKRTKPSWTGMKLLSMKFDAKKIMREIDHIDGWSESPRITFKGSPHRDTYDIILRGPIDPHTSDMVTLHQQLECEDYAMSIFPDIQELVSNMFDHVKGTKLGRVILAKLPPGQVVHPHADEGPVPEKYTRYHAIIQAGPGSWFLVGHAAENMTTGQVWIANVLDKHCVVNLDDEARVHLIVDIMV